jgi:hypothetical protein
MLPRLFVCLFVCFRSVVELKIRLQTARTIGSNYTNKLVNTNGLGDRWHHKMLPRAHGFPHNAHHSRSHRARTKEELPHKD